MSFNVLISSAGRRVALGRIWRRTLAELGLDGALLAADASPLSPAYHDADRAFTVPRAADAGFTGAMLELCRRETVALIVPTNDLELAVYAENRGRFAESGTTVAISAPEVVEIGADKALTNAWLTGNGFPTVRQSTPKGAAGWDYPLLVKPRRGSASIGVGVVRDAAELAATTREGDFVVETIAPGVEYTIDVLADRAGRCVCAVPRRRLEVRSGESSKGVTARCPALEELCARICEALPGAYGPLTMQVMVDEVTGGMAVIEINPRFGGGYPLTWEAGGRYPRWIVEEILGLPSTASADAWREGLVMLRYDEAVFVERDRG